MSGSGSGSVIWVRELSLALVHATVVISIYTTFKINLSAAYVSLFSARHVLFYD